MDNDLVSVSEQRFSRSMSKPVSGAGDEDTSLLVGVRRRRRRSLFLPRIQRGLRDGRCGCHKGRRGYYAPLTGAHRLPTVDDQGVPNDEARSRAAQPKHHRRDLLGLADPADGQGF